MKKFFLVFYVFMLASVICLVHTSAQSPVRVTVTAPAPVFVKPDAAITPLRLAKEGSVLRVIASEGEWYRIEFQDPQWGIRVGYIEKRHVSAVAAPDQQAVDLSVTESRQPTSHPFAQSPGCTTGNQQGSMSAIVDGVSWTTTCVNVQIVTLTTKPYEYRPERHATQVYIVGNSDWNDHTGVRGISVAGLPEASGTFPLDKKPYLEGGPKGNPSVGVHLSFNTGSLGARWSRRVPIGSGTVTITTYTSTHIEGTFSAIVHEMVGKKSVRSMTITDGRFDITYTR